MILYLDTSALVEVYVREPGREVVARAVSESSGISTSLVSYAEGRAAFARSSREGGLTGEEHAKVVLAIDDRWRTYKKIPVTESLVELAGNFTQRYALRGCDAIQFASAFTCRGRERNLQFLAFDKDLNKAAEQIVPVYEAAKE